MDRSERYALARRAWVAWSLEAKRSTPERRTEAATAGGALIAAMERTPGQPLSVVSVAAWVGIDVEQFVGDVAAEMKRPGADPPPDVDEECSC